MIPKICYVCKAIHASPPPPPLEQFSKETLLRISPSSVRAGAYMVLNRVRLDEWRSGSLASLCIIAGIGDSLPELYDRPASPTSAESQISMATACETFVSCPTPTHTPLRWTSSHCLDPNRYYLGLESPAGLRWLQSPAITAMPGRSSTKRRVCPPDVSEPAPSLCNWTYCRCCNDTVSIYAVDSSQNSRTRQHSISWNTTTRSVT